MMKINKLIFIFSFSILFSKNLQNEGLLDMIKNNSNIIKKQKNDPLEQIFIQAKNLERAGLYKEALVLYKQINNENPGQKKYYLSLKNQLKQKELWDTLFVYTKKYSIARENDFQSKLELIDIYIWKNETQKWKNIVSTIISEEKNNQNSIKALIQRLINNGQYEFAYEILNDYRKKSTDIDFYSMEIASFFAMRMAYEQAIVEYLLFLDNNPTKFQIISDRILAFPDTPENIININSQLQKSNVQQAKFILANYKLKSKEYESGYKLLKQNNASASMLLDYAKDLANIKQYKKAEIILMDIIESKENENIMNLALYEIAKIFESKIIKNKIKLPFSSYYSNNHFLSSPYISVEESTTYALNKAMNIYDSLRVTKKNAQATYRLAEVQFKILGDLDRAYNLFNETYKFGNTKGLRLDAAMGMINVLISKGNLNKAENLTNELKKNSQKKIDYEIKLAQIYFYKGNLIKAKKSMQEIIKILPKNHLLYNDILNIISIIIAFKDNPEEFTDYTNIQLNIQQNNRIEAIEKLKLLFNSNDIFISEMCKFQHVWLLYLQNELDNIEQKIELINGDTIFKEKAAILKAEILDYIKKDISKAIDSYLIFLDNYPNSIYYDDIRLRLRKITS